jgi:hypothetical protein
MHAALSAARRDSAVGWTDWLMYCSILAYVSIAIAEFVAVLGLGDERYVRLLAVSILVAVVVCSGSEFASVSRFQELTTSLKCVAF